MPRLEPRTFTAKVITAKYDRSPIVSQVSSTRLSTDNVSQMFWVRVPTWEFFCSVGKTEFVMLESLKGIALN